MSIFSKFKEAFGLNLKTINCPECEAPQPKVRKPKNMRQVMWGGSTCENCNCEMDKWGKKIQA